MLEIILKLIKSHSGLTVDDFSNPLKVIKSLTEIIPTMMEESSSSEVFKFGYIDPFTWRSASDIIQGGYKSIFMIC